MDFGFFVFDLGYFDQSTLVVVSDVFALGGWVILCFVLLKAFLFVVAMYKETLYVAQWEWVVLAVDVPQENIQTPRAVEQLFTHIYSIMEPPSIGHVYRRGFRQFSYSFEIVSIGGYIQFLVRTLKKYQYVVENAIYAQYPDAEITEVEDYVKDIPDNYPNDTHEVFALDYKLVNHWSYPIRTYEEFEHSISKDTVFKDPMGTILESFTRIGPGEQMWMQIIIEPTQEKNWKPEAIEEVKKVIGEKPNKSKGIFSFLYDNPLVDELKYGMDEVHAQMSGLERSTFEKAKDDDGPPNQILYLTPGQKKVVEGMEEKLRKLGYRSKVRLVYVARKEVYNPSRGVNSFTGALNQFTIPSSNALLPKYLTSTQYLFAKARKDYRRRVLMNAYKNREIDMGKPGYMLSIEELATLWHFPMGYVKTPQLQKAGAKAAEPPIDLPVEGYAMGSMEEEDERISQNGGSVKEDASEPVGTPYLTDDGETRYHDGPEFG
jgi:hypothetical protein